METIFTTVESKSISLLIQQLTFAMKMQTRTQIGGAPQQPFTLPSIVASQTSTTMVPFLSTSHVVVNPVPNSHACPALCG